MHGRPNPSPLSRDCVAQTHEPRPSAIPPDVPRALLERKFVRGERREDYGALLESICFGLKVRNVIEFLPAQSIADAVWEGLRLRRLRDAHLCYLDVRAARELIREALEPYIADHAERLHKADAIHRAWCKGIGDGPKEVSRLLDDMGVELDAIGARAFVKDLDTQVKLEALDRQKQRQRQAALGELTALRRLRQEDAKRSLELQAQAYGESGEDALPQEEANSSAGTPGQPLGPEGALLVSEETRTPAPQDPSSRTAAPQGPAPHGKDMGADQPPQMHPTESNQGGQEPSALQRHAHISGRN
jgi:hypothetical protein